MPITYEFEPARADDATLVKRGETVTFEARLYTRQGIPTVEPGDPFVATGYTVTMSLARAEPRYSGTLVNVLNASGSVDGSLTNLVRAQVTLPTSAATLPDGNALLQWKLVQGGVTLFWPGANKYQRVVVGKDISA